jgi:hypothetical protein
VIEMGPDAGEHGGMVCFEGSVDALLRQNQTTTGRLLATRTAQRGQHRALATEFLDMRGALEVTGWWGEDRLTVIPGNHDRFNLYEHMPTEPMEAFFPVVTSRKPRFKTLPGGVALLEIDSNRDPVDDRHHLEKWLPNTVGRISVCFVLRDTRSCWRGCSGWSARTRRSSGRAGWGRFWER